MLTQSLIAMAGLDPAIQVPAAAEPGAEGGVDHRVKPGDDDCEPS